MIGRNKVIHKRFGNDKNFYYKCNPNHYAYKCNSSEDWKDVTCILCLKHIYE